LGIKASQFAYNVRYINSTKGSNFLGKIKSVFKAFLNMLLAFEISLKYRDVDLIYTNTSDIYVGYILSHLVRAPHIWHIREFGFEDQNRQHFMGEKRFYRLVGSSSKVITISKALKSKLIKYNVPDYKVKMVYNDVENKLKQFNKKYNLDKPLSLLFVGSITEEKGADFIFNSLLYCKSKGLKFKLSVVGDDNTAYSKNLKNKIFNSICKDDIEFLGYCKDVNEIRKEHDIALVASKAEAFGRVTIEAMHAKMLVIATNLGANPELIKNNENGFLFEDGNINEVYNLLLKIDKNRRLLEEFGSKAHEFSKQFSINAAAKKIDSELKKLIA